MGGWLCVWVGRGVGVCVGCVWVCVCDILIQSLLKSLTDIKKILLFCDTRLVGNHKRVTFNVC